MARQKRRDKSEILTRTEKWELKLTPETEQLVVKISDALRDYYNWALDAEKTANERYQAAIKAAPDIKPNEKRFLSEIDLYNLWKEVRAEDAKQSLFRAKVPANWVLETFKSAVGAYKSFFALVKNGDLDARTPGPRPEWRFQAIPGCSAFSIKVGKKVVLAPEIFGRDTLSFPIPPTYQVKMLGRAMRVAKFIIHRDEPNTRQPGCYWISISYEISKPESKPFVPEQAVYVALGASSIGIVSAKGEELIDLWRPDKYWKPKIDEVSNRCESQELKAGSGIKRRGTALRGSRKWQKRRAASRRMNTIMARQQTQDRREIVAIDLIEKIVDGIISGHGVHFVITELVVRSKEGKLADASQTERSGALGLNWQAQNIGSIGYLAQWLEIKVAEYGGTVHKHKLLHTALPKNLSEGHENKIPIARALREDFLRSLQKAQ